ncbi:MAG: N-acetylmuramoyl-L-alanine amidase [Candidatus Kerfeldbacteria bacterium]|nr:N-acetylmuramoyl-L-alanine amidase [Candidatus Kerfeldbacteria bacterium]
MAAFLIFSASWVWHQQRAAAADGGPRSGSEAHIRARVIREQRFNQSADNAATGLSLPNRDGAFDRVATYTSPILDAEYAFNGIALDWIADEPDATRTRIVLRVRDRGTWTDWFPVEASDDIQKPLTGDTRQYMDPWFVSAADAFQYRIVQRTDQPRVTPRLGELRITYLDSTRGPDGLRTGHLSWWQRMLRPATTASAAGVPVISRADWGADESLRYTSDGDERWPRQYADVEKFIIHHTAGSDGGDDPAATIRGIYYFHAITRGWGDIGYNYLVDPAGRIYAGRVGGAGVVGAHTYNEQADTDFNRGSVGISVLGNYQTTDVLSDAAEDALESLIATKAIDAGITPSGESTFRDQLLPNVIAHRDVDATACPGQDIVSRLENIRDGAQEKFRDAGGLAGLRRSVAVVDVTPSSLTLAPGASARVVIQYRNTGTVNLTQRGLRAVFLRTSTENPLDHPSWDSAQRVSDIDDAEIAPGETGSVTFSIRAPRNTLQATGRFRLAYRDGGVQFVGGSGVTVRVRIEGYRYAGERDSVELPSQTTAGSVDWVSLRFVNRGTEPWFQRDLRLWVYDLDRSPSVYRYHRWSHSNGLIRMVQQRVNPGGVATFRYRQQSPAIPGRYRQEFLLRNGDATVVGSGIARTTRVTSGLRGQLLSIQAPPVVRRVWRFPAVLELKNRGTMAWDRDVALVVTAPSGGTSLFWDASWEGTEVAAPVTTGTVAQRSVTFVTVWFEAPRTTGIIGSRIRLLDRSSNQWVDGIDVPITVRVDP